MDIELDTMLDIALGGPEIGPLNLQVLHGVMREMFRRMDLSKQNIVVEKESSEFCNSFNFIKSKIDEKNRRPTTAGGSPSKFKSNISVIVSDYACAPIGEQIEGSAGKNISATNVEDRLRYVESELKNFKDFPSVDELRSWTNDKANPDTVVTDLWHFVSLNHRVNGLEEGIQKLTKLVDKFIPELKSLGEGQNITNGKLDDLYSQFKGLSDRLTYIDTKLDSNVNDIFGTIEKKSQITLDLTKNLENRITEKHPKFRDLEKCVSAIEFAEVQEKARITLKDIREQIASKINYTILEDMVGKDDFKRYADMVNSLNSSLNDFAKLQDLDKYVKTNVYESVEESTKSNKKEIDLMNVTLAGKADLTTVSEFAFKKDVEKLSSKIGGLEVVNEQQTNLYNKMYKIEEQLKRKADNDDVIDVLKKEDMKKTFNKIQNHQCAINDLQNWQRAFESDEKPIINSKVNELVNQASELKKSFNVFQEEQGKPNVEAAVLQDSLLHLTNNFQEHEKVCKSNISGILGNIDLKLDKAEIEPLKNYLEGCYNSLAHQYQESLGGCQHQIHHPKKSQSMPYISPSSINISKKSHEDLSTSDSFIHPKNDAAAMRSQMKYNCLSCSQPIVQSSSPQTLSTVRGKPLNAYELEHLRLLQKVLKAEEKEDEIRACGGRYTSSVPYKKTGRSSAKSIPSKKAFTNPEGVLIDGEVDIEGLDGKLYRGLISRKDLLCPNRCKSANAEIRTVNSKPSSGKDRPISGKSTDFRVNYARVMSTG